MQARLSQSKSWTQFPSEFLEQVQELVAETFEDHLIEDAALHLDGRIYPEEIVFRLGIHTPGQLKQSNFDVSADYKADSQNAKKVMNHCIEASAAMMAEFFDMGEDEDFPRQWMEFNFEGTPLFIRYTTENTALEAEADRLLGADFKVLVKEESSEDALDHVVPERIQTSSDDEDESEDFDDLNFEGDESENDDDETVH